MEEKTVQVKVLRAFLLKGEPQKVNSTLTVGEKLARELASYNKVEVVKPGTVAQPESKPAAKRPAQGASDARE